MYFGKIFSLFFFSVSLLGTFFSPSHLFLLGPSRKGPVRERLKNENVLSTTTGLRFDYYIPLIAACITTTTHHPLTGMNLIMITTSILVISCVWLRVPHCRGRIRPSISLSSSWLASRASHRMKLEVITPKEGKLTLCSTYTRQA